MQINSESERERERERVNLARQTTDRRRVSIYFKSVAIFFYVGFLFLGFATQANAAAFTSKASGNWSSAGQTTWNEAGVPGTGDTVTISNGHTITVDANTSIGATTVEGGLTIGAYTLTMEGALTIGNGTGKLGTLTFNDGATLALGSNNLLLNNSQLRRGTYGGTWAAITGTGNIQAGTVSCTFVGKCNQSILLSYISIQNTGTITFALGGYGGGATNELNLSQCAFTGTSAILIGQAGYTPAATPRSVTYCDFRTAATAGVYIQFTGNGNPSSTHVFSNNTVSSGGAVGVRIGGDGWDLTSNVLVGAGIGTNGVNQSGGHTITDSYFSFPSGTSGNAIILDITSPGKAPSTLTGNYINLIGVANAHPTMATGQAGDAAQVVSGNIFELTSSGDPSNLFFGGNRQFSIINNIYIGWGSFLSFLGANSLNQSSSIDHNTFLQKGGSQGVYGAFLLCEASGNTNGYGNIRSNIHSYATGTSPSGEYGASNLTAITGQSIETGDYNDWDRTSYPYGAPTYPFTVTGGSTHDLANVDPQFVDKTRALATWTAGGAIGTPSVANAETYLLVINGYNSTTKTQSDTPSAQTPADLVTWVKNGFKVTSAALNNAGHDGVTIGAMGYVSADATVTSATYTVSALVAGAGTITNVPYETSQATFLAALTLAAGASWNTASVADPVVSTNTLLVTAQDGVTTGTYTITVNKITPTLSVTNSPVTYNASPQAATVSGSVAGTVSNVQYNGSGTVPTNVGTYAITADFTPDDTTSYNSLTGASAGDFVISTASQSILTAVSTPSTVTYGTTATLSTTGGSGTGAVTFSVGASTGCNITGGTTLNVSDASGTCTVTATKAADTNYNSVNSAGLTVTLAKATQSTLNFTGQTVTSPSTFSTLSTTGGSGTGSITYAVTTAGTAGCSITGTTLSYTTAGTCGVTATKAADSNYNSASSSEATFTINAASPTTYTITPSAGSHGSISPSDATTVNSGENQSFTITADSGYHVSDVLVDSVSVGAVSLYSFTNVTANHTISATFAITSTGGGGGGMPWFYITISAGKNGKITSPSGQTWGTSFPYGSDQIFTITPDTGYEITDVLVDSVSVGPQKSYTFKNINQSHSISAIFSKIETVNTIENMTPEQKQAKIQELIALINNLKQQLAQMQNLPSAVFTTPLYIGVQSADVRRLQTLLATKPEIYPEGKITGYFGLLTKQAVQRFQLQYKLVDLQSDPAFGYVGPKTRMKLQEVFSNK